MKKLIFLVAFAALFVSCNKDKPKQYPGMRFSVEIMEGAHHREFRCEAVNPGMAFNCIDTSSDKPAGLVLFQNAIAILNKVKE